VSLASFIVVAQVALARDRSPRVVLLGSGDHVSAMIVTGNARLLIATGTDGAAFLNAFSSALPFGDRRIDVLVIAGSASDLPVAAAARDSIDARRTFVLDGGLTASLDKLGLDSSALFTGGKKIALSPDLAIWLETASIANGETTIQGWQAVIERGKTRVRVVSDARLLSAFHDRRPASALVIAAKPDPTALPAAFRSLVIPASIANAAPLIPQKSEPAPVMKCEPGRSLTLTFTTDGLKLPKSAQLVSSATPHTDATMVGHASGESSAVVVKRFSSGSWLAAQWAEVV
jgi:hypothetical protein